MLVLGIKSDDTVVMFKNICHLVTSFLTLISSLKCNKVVNAMGMITEKGKLQNGCPHFFQHHMLLVHIEKK